MEQQKKKTHQITLMLKKKDLKKMLLEKCFEIKKYTKELTILFKHVSRETSLV